MAVKSEIEWTDATWNPTTGCDKISPGCKYCYAERLARRLHGTKNPSYLNGFELTLQPRMLALPLGWKKPTRIFVNSMSDLLHKDMPLEYIQRVLDVMRQTPQHTYQVLTKRDERLEIINPEIDWPTNLWMGVSVENQDYVRRIDHLRRTHARVKFLSLEPLLGPLEVLDLTNIDWVIVGGESGPRARPMEADWVRSIRDQCVRAGVPFFFKQWGGKNKKKTGRVLDGRTWNEMPVHTGPSLAIHARPSRRSLPLIHRPGDQNQEAPPSREAALLPDGVAPEHAA